MPAVHKNKTFTTLLALLLGGAGIHHFYLHGARARFGWLHAAAVPASALIWLTAPQQDSFFQAAPLLVSYIVGFIETLVIGLTSDEKWDAAHNGASGRQSDSGWMLAVLLVSTMMIGTVTLIGSIARMFDLLYTGGAYG